MTEHTQEQGTTLVLGATGKTGRRVAERLTRLGRSPRLGSRSGQPPFDWTDEGTWEPVLRGVRSVYLTYQPDAGFPGAPEAIGAFAKLAASSGVEHVVLLSGRGEEGAQRSEQAVREAGTAWTIVRASFFAQNFSEDFLAEGIRDGVVAFFHSDVVEPFIDVEDIADVAVAALTEPGHRGQLYEVTGPQLMTFEEAVAEISTALGRELRYLRLSAEEFRAGMIEQGLPQRYAEDLTDLVTSVLDGRNAYLSDGVQRALGREPRRFADYARATAATGAWNV